jgi:threonine aldolase
MEAFLADDLWLRLARHANAMADRLSEGLAAAGYAPAWPVEANEVFVALPVGICERLQQAGATFYPWTSDSLPNGATPQRGNKQGGSNMIRLVCSFATEAVDVDRFVATVKT